MKNNEKKEIRVIRVGRFNFVAKINGKINVKTQSYSAEFCRDKANKVLEL